MGAQLATIGLTTASFRVGALLKTTTATKSKTLILVPIRKVGCFVTWMAPTEKDLSGKGLSGLVRLICHQRS